MKKLNAQQKSEMVFILESPFQVIQAYEYFHRKELSATFFIRLNAQLRNNIQLKETSKLLGLKNVIEIPSKKHLKKMMRLILLLVRLRHARQIIFGDAASIYFKILRYFLDKEKIILLDDGVSTLLKLRGSRFKKFSIFPGSNVELNDFTLVKDRIKSIQQSRSTNNRINATLILGSCVVESGICSAKSYHDTLEKMILHNKDFEGSVIYIPHRREAKRNVDNLSIKFDFQQKYLSYPVELIAATENINPIRIYGALSTGLFSLKKIFPYANVKCFPIKTGELVERKKAITELYEIIEAYPNIELVL